MPMALLTIPTTAIKFRSVAEGGDAPIKKNAYSTFV